MNNPQNIDLFPDHTQLGRACHGSLHQFLESALIDGSKSQQQS